MKSFSSLLVIPAMLAMLLIPATSPAQPEVKPSGDGGFVMVTGWADVCEVPNVGEGGCVCPPGCTTEVASYAGGYYHILPGHGVVPGLHRLEVACR